MRKGDIFDGGWFGFYKNIGIIELEGNWDLAEQDIIDKTGQKIKSRRLFPTSGIIHFVNVNCIEIKLEAVSTSTISKLEFYNKSNGKLFPKIVKAEQKKLY